MTSVIRAVCACYSVLLVLHPRAVRERYGDEMVEVLREQMRDIGPLRAAGVAVYDLATVVLPSRLCKQTTAVVSLALGTSSAMLFAVYRVVLDQDILDPLMRSIGLQC